MHLLVDRLRRFAKSWIARRNDNRIGQILAMENDSTACPSPDQIAPVLGHVRVSPKVTKRKRRVIPTIKPDRRKPRVFEQRFIDRHVQRRGARLAIVKRSEEHTSELQSRLHLV